MRIDVDSKMYGLGFDLPDVLEKPLSSSKCKLLFELIGLLVFCFLLIMVLWFVVVGEIL